MKINLAGCEFRTLFVFREVGGLDQLSVISQKKKEIGNPAILILKRFCVVSATYRFVKELLTPLGARVLMS